MTDDLLTEARHLASRGWLPGIAPHFDVMSDRVVSEADLHIAAHKEIVRRGWACQVVSKHGCTHIYDWELNADLSVKTDWTLEERGTTTLSLLRCLRGGGTSRRSEAMKSDIDVWEMMKTDDSLRNRVFRRIRHTLLLDEDKHRIYVVMMERTWRCLGRLGKSYTHHWKAKRGKR